jgi:hypothetical protein
MYPLLLINIFRSFNFSTVKIMILSRYRTKEHELKIQKNYQIFNLAILLSFKEEISE